ncbi:MAG TPA: amino acid permease [Steroidobacteraceae bacterium]|nr:amino acid permease [Steroidobacteraceae bacterium]
MSVDSQGLPAAPPVRGRRGDSASGAAPELRRTMSVVALTAFGIGSIIGTGIFVLTGTAAANQAGPALVLSFVIAGCSCALVALCYAELAAMIPVSGSAYSYAHAAFGEIVAWFIGWNLVLEYTFSVATVSVGWSGYVVSLLAQLGLHLPAALAQAPLDRGAGSFAIVTTGAWVNVPAVLIIAAIATLCYVGIRESTGTNTIIVALKVAVIALFVLAGVSYIHPANWHPFIPPNTGHFGQFGWSGVLAGAGVIVFSYIGFDTISTCAQEAKRPERDMPLGIIASLAICSVLYMATVVVLTGMVSYRDLNVAAPVAVAIDRYPGLRWLGIGVKLGAILGMTSTMLVMTVGQARIFMSMARDGLLPPWFCRIHPRFKTPANGTWVTGLAAAIIGGLLPVRILGELVSIGTLLAFITVCLGVLYLRRAQPELPRPFRVPWPRFICIGGALACAAMIVALPRDTWIRLIVWTVIGFLIYGFYGRCSSRRRREAV